LRLEIASEAREAQLAYLVGALGKSNFAVIDNGSRSIELVTRSASGYQWDVFYRLSDCVSAVFWTCKNLYGGGRWVS
jgi:hypothetical protein